MLFKTAFLERFFPRETKEAKVEEFIILKHDSTTIKKYPLKFVKLSRYGISLVSNSRDEMSRFLTMILEYLVEECRQLCCMKAWTFSVLWSMSKEWRNVGKGNTIGQGTCEGKMRRIFQGRLVLKSGISLGLKRESPTKGIQVHPRVAMIEILILELK